VSLLTLAAVVLCVRHSQLIAHDRGRAARRRAARGGRDCGCCCRLAQSLHQGFATEVAAGGCCCC
jgi:hypothetical protein